MLKDKILISGDAEHQNIQVTNDGATILKSIGVDNPAAKVLVGKLTGKGRVSIHCASATFRHITDTGQGGWRWDYLGDRLSG